MSLTTRTFHTKEGKPFTLDFPAPRDGRSVFVVAGHKTGSTLLSHVIDAIAEVTGLPAIQVESGVWKQGIAINEWPEQLYLELACDGYVFHSFRWLQKLPLVHSFGHARKIFLIRDPRDIAVSYYYSMVKSHVLPPEGKSREAILSLRGTAGTMSIDEFIQRDKAGPPLRNIQNFAAYLEDPSAIFYRYEEVIFRKREWVRRIASDLGVDLAPQAADAIADRHDIRPKREDISSHIRQVTPGGYITKLSDQSIEYIRERYPVFFNKYGYQ